MTRTVALVLIIAASCLAAGQTCNNAPFNIKPGGASKASALPELLLSPKVPIAQLMQNEKFANLKMKITATDGVVVTPGAGVKMAFTVEGGAYTVLLMRVLNVGETEIDGKAGVGELRILGERAGAEGVKEYGVIATQLAIVERNRQGQMMSWDKMTVANDALQPLDISTPFVSFFPADTNLKISYYTAVANLKDGLGSGKDMPCAKWFVLASPLLVKQTTLDKFGMATGAKTPEASTHDAPSNITSIGFDPMRQREMFAMMNPKPNMTMTEQTTLTNKTNQRTSKQPSVHTTLPQDSKEGKPTKPTSSSYAMFSAALAPLFVSIVML